MFWGVGGLFQRFRHLLNMTDRIFGSEKICAGICVFHDVSSMKFSLAEYFIMDIQTPGVYHLRSRSLRATGLFNLRRHYFTRCLEERRRE